MARSSVINRGYVDEESGGVFTGFSGFPSGEPPTNVDVPYVGGTGTVGSELTCTMGNWTGEPTGYTYTWMREDLIMWESVVDNTYTVAAGDAGHSIHCIVAATNAWGTTDAPPSNAVVVSATRGTGGHRG